MARENFTAARVAGFTCPAGKGQAFLWSSRVPQLAVRVTRRGARAYMFQSRLKTGLTVRMTIGDPRAWSIPAAESEARRLQGLIDQGKDPRVEQRTLIAQHEAEQRAAKSEKARLEITGLAAWDAYCAERRSRWSERNLADHTQMVQQGGEPRTRMPDAVTQPGMLRALLNRPLAAIDADVVRTWVTRESAARPGRASLGFRLLGGFINWCAEHPVYGELVVTDACTRKRTREKLPKRVPKRDALQREQLRPWFEAVQGLSRVASTYLQVLLLTGARREEVAALKWKDVDFQWRTLRLRDKVDEERVIPLTPFVAVLLEDLKRYNDTPPKPPSRVLKFATGCCA